MPCLTIRRMNVVFTCEEYPRLRRRLIQQQRRRHGCGQKIVVTAGTADRDETVGSSGPWIRSPSRDYAFAWLRYYLIAKDSLSRRRKKCRLIPSRTVVAKPRSKALARMERSTKFHQLWPRRGKESFNELTFRRAPTRNFIHLLSVRRCNGRR